MLDLQDISDSNTLSGDGIGQMVSARKYMSDSYGQPEDFWYSYDHIRNVMNLSDENGDETEEFAQDAFGNVLSSAQTGAWASDPSGRHETTKEMDGNVGLYYFSSRWYDSKVSIFTSKSSYSFDIEKPYGYSKSNPVIYYDNTGKYPSMVNSSNYSIFSGILGNWMQNEIVSQYGSVYGRLCADVVHIQEEGERNIRDYLGDTEYEYLIGSTDCMFYCMRVADQNHTRIGFDGAFQSGCEERCEKVKECLEKNDE